MKNRIYRTLAIGIGMTAMFATSGLHASVFYTAKVNIPFDSAAKTAKAKVLVVVAKYDHVVTPGPATEFAHLLDAKLLVLDSDCGHLATTCESHRLNEAIAHFLK